MRGLHNLLRHFDVPIVYQDAMQNDQTMPDLELPHIRMTKLLAIASCAYSNYRNKIKQIAFSTSKSSALLGIANVETIRECMVNDSLTSMYMSEQCKELLIVMKQSIKSRYANSVLTEYENGYFEKLYKFFHDNPNASTARDRTGPSKGSNYWATLIERFRDDMKAGNVSVKRAHNIAIQTSKSAGGNISHFPNYHISRCNALLESDRARSASSQNESTWILQQLAGMMPLSKRVCAKMMGRQTLSVNVVQQSFELFKTDAEEGSRPTVLQDGTGGIGDTDAYSGHPAAPTGPMQPLASDQLSTNLMVSILSLFHPSAYVRTETSGISFVPAHVKESVMMAFANAMDQNVTHTDELEKALCELFVDTPDHVAFCCESASTTFTMDPRRYTDEQQRAERLAHPVPWKDVPIVNGEAGAPVFETPEDRILRVKACFVWDAFENKAAMPVDSDIDREGQRRRGLEIHPMRSFSPASMSAAPAPLVAGAIHSGLDRAARSAAAFCRDPANWDAFFKHVLLVWMARFFKATSRFVDNGAGMLAVDDTGGVVKVFANGMHFMHGSRLPYLGADPNKKDAGVTPCDIVILRPNIEHEMLGVIMGRGGTQELGATFWGQTELSCYDDSQHGIWGMSYKYHERAMVTNERNLIRVYDVAFDGYNGGLDQTCVEWNDRASLKKYRDCTYDRSKPYSGPSMIVMALPCAESRQAWPNPIVFHGDIASNYCPDPEKTQGALPNLQEHMVFSHDKNPRGCSRATQLRYQQYMAALEMTQWASIDQSNRPAGESCVANESTSSPMAFQGSMRVISSAGQTIEEVKGSGHLGHSYVGIASVREGRGVLNPAAQHSMMRLV